MSSRGGESNRGDDVAAYPPLPPPDTGEAPSWAVPRSAAQGRQNGVIRVTPFLTAIFPGVRRDRVRCFVWGHRWIAIHPDQRSCFRCGRIEEWKETLDVGR